MRRGESEPRTHAIGVSSKRISRGLNTRASQGEDDILSSGYSSPRDNKRHTPDGVCLLLVTHRGIRTTFCARRQQKVLLHLAQNKQILRICGVPFASKSLTNKKPAMKADFLFVGDPSGNRTPDTLIKSQVLYRLS